MIDPTMLAHRTGEIIKHVRDHPGGVRASDVERVLGPDSRRYLARLVEAGRLRRLSRGVYASLSDTRDSGTHGTVKGGATPCPHCDGTGRAPVTPETTQNPLSATLEPERAPVVPQQAPATPTFIEPVEFGASTARPT